MDEERWPPESMGEVRTRELELSLQILGVDEHVWLDMRDVDMDTGLPDEGYGRIREIVADVHPDTILTFGPDGMTGHDDHRTISSWVTEAWRRSGRRAALWYATLTPEFHAAWGPLNDRVGLWCEGTQPPVTPRRHLVAEVVCTGTLGDLKHRALRAHASQTRPLEELVGAETYRRWWSTESFVAAEAPVSRSSATVDAGRRGSTYADRHALRPPASA